MMKTRAWLVVILVVEWVNRAGAADTIPAADRYTAVAKQVEALIRHEMTSKGLPGLSIALVDDQNIVWAGGFGHAESKRNRPATAETVYRVGSVSKLFTAIGIMQLAEQGLVDLDAPIEKYVPEFRPLNPFNKPITLRQLVSHRSGLVRESPVGSYFDPDEPSLADSVDSLNRTHLVYPPTTRTKYSNAGVAVVGYVLERLLNRRFDDVIEENVLKRIGMDRSSFAVTPEIAAHVAAGVMWTYDGRSFAAPTFKLGTSPAGNLYANMIDLARFLCVLFAGGKTKTGQLLKPDTLQAMWTPQFVGPAEKSGFGLGFSVSELDDRRRIGHGGAVYGFATQLSALPDEKLGVAVASNRDVANAALERVAEFALRAMLASRNGGAVPMPKITNAVDAKLARKLAGQYVAGENRVELFERFGRLFMRRGARYTELKMAGDNLIVDDVHAHGPEIQRIGADVLRIDHLDHRRVASAEPAPAPQRWFGLIGEYGWDHNTLYVLEEHGRLCVLIEWVFYYPLTEVEPDVFAFPNDGLYHGERLNFRRDAMGRTYEVEAAGVVFKRRLVGPETGQTFRVQPVRPLPDLRRQAMRAQPPAEPGRFYPSKLVEVVRLDPTIKLDVRYATDNNFLGTVFYSEPRVFVQQPAAEALIRAHRRLKEFGYGLLLYDGYRPWHVTKMFWDATPEHLRRFVADPSRGSRHNRGCAVDVGLFSLQSGAPVELVSGYDEFSPRAFPDYSGGTSLQRWRRELLRQAMHAEGFSVYAYEWWHFDYVDWDKYPILNLRFDQIDAADAK
jgi:CubicO group peptidase (beta-lactamase class C family)/D-alanyl-D-alanine dipeptidase